MYAKVLGKPIEEFCGRKVILFGCGSYGIRAQEEFERVGARIIAYCDNNREKQGMTLNNYPVVSPDVLYTFPDTDIIIASTFSDEIEKQLLEMKLTNFYHIKLGVFREILPKEQFFNQVSKDKEANDYLFDAISSPGPFFIGRLGSTELECIAHYLYFSDRRTDKQKEYPNNVKMMMNIFSGFFPMEDALLDRFCATTLEGLSDMDMIWSMWFSKYEDMIYREFTKGQRIADYDRTVFPLQEKRPWTEALKGKKVLVIHPFEESIRENYKQKNKLFMNEKFLPDFELTTLKAVQSIAGNKTEYGTWFDALAGMERKMDKIDFDIALIGAGAYGLPLGAYAKKLGKKALHIGGILQLYFGIKGKVWNSMNIYNEYWTSPKESETPADFKKVEAGRYWK